MAPEHSVEQLLALDNSALVEFIRANRDAAEAAIDISNIKDWTKASESRQTELLQRLIGAYPFAEEPPLSCFLDHLLAKLDGILAQRETLQELPHTLPSPEAGPRTLSPDTGTGRAHQIRCYHELVNDGGRPPCSLEMLDEIYRRPADFAELLRPWLENPAFTDLDDLGVFSRPLERWKQFRRWQHDNRGSSTGSADESLAAFREERRRRFESAGLGVIVTRPDFDETIRRMWQQEQTTHRPDRAREVEDGSFTQYVRAARRRLAKHGFREPFRLLKDPRRQGGRATWIEFLEFECWWLDANAQTVRRWRSPYEAALEKLVESWVLSARETEEALSGTLPTFVPDGQQITPRDEAIQRFMMLTTPYFDAKAVESRQSLRVQWAWRQIAAVTPSQLAGETEERQLEEEEDEHEDIRGGPMRRRGPAAKKQRQEPDGVGDTSPKKTTTTATRRRNTSGTAGLLALAGPAWAFEEGIRRSTRHKDAEERAKGVDRPLGTLRALP